MQRTRRSDDRARRTGPRLAFTLAALFAVFLQAFVVQTHVHAFGLLNSAAYDQAVSGNSDTAHASTAHHQAACVVCEALATSGRAALPEAPPIVAGTHASHDTTTPEIRHAPRTLAHSWQSRAPPIAL